MILFPVAIVEGDCQLVYGMEGSGFALFPVCYQILEAIWQPLIVRDVRSGSGVTWNGAELLRSGRELTTKVGEQPWPQLVRCASIYCRACGCVFQED